MNITYGKILWPNGNISHKSQYDFLLSILSCKLDIWWVFWGNDPWNVWSKGDDKHFENLSKSWHRDCTWFVVLWGFLYLQSTLDRFLDVAWYLKDSTSEFFVSTSDNVWRKSLLYNCATAVVLFRTSFLRVWRMSHASAWITYTNSKVKKTENCVKGCVVLSKLLR